MHARYVKIIDFCPYCGDYAETEQVCLSCGARPQRKTSYTSEPCRVCGCAYCDDGTHYPESDEPCPSA
jgi:hypothetical protein